MPPSGAWKGPRTASSLWKVLGTSHSDLKLSPSVQIVSSASTDLQDYTYYFVPAPWLSVKLLRLLQCYLPPGIRRLPTPRDSVRSALSVVFWDLGPWAG